MYFILITLIVLGNTKFFYQDLSIDWRQMLADPGEFPTTFSNPCTTPPRGAVSCSSKLVTCSDGSEYPRATLGLERRTNKIKLKHWTRGL